MNETNINRDLPVLVTGGTGFVGAYLLRRLLQLGYTNIRVLRRSSSPMQLVAPFAERIQWIEGDILDIFDLEDAMEGVQHVYHCAAVVSFDPAQRKHMLSVNQQGTANVVNAALHQQVGKLVYVSSIAALGRSKEGETITEASKWEHGPYNTYYAISKFKGEQEVWRGMAEGLRVAVVNPAIVLGSGYWESGTARFFSVVHRGQSFYPVGTTALVDVRDVADFTVRLTESNVDGERYILNATHYTYQRLLTDIAGALGVSPPSYGATPLLRALAWRTEWLRSKLTGSSPLLTRETAANSSRTFYYDNQKSTGWPDFEYLPIEETIKATAAQFLAYQQSGEVAAMLPPKY